MLIIYFQIGRKPETWTWTWNHRRLPRGTAVSVHVRNSWMSLRMSRRTRLITSRSKMVPSASRDPGFISVIRGSWILDGALVLVAVSSCLNELLMLAFEAAGGNRGRCCSMFSLTHDELRAPQDMKTQTVRLSGEAVPLLSQDGLWDEGSHCSWREMVIDRRCANTSPPPSPPPQVNTPSAAFFLLSLQFQA